ncbi:hypothetical protein TNCV_64921 [Trichonephila clavipes]|nr:hypothetical protein TNCV_64921 [Trichonephila clavipes]
MYNKLLLYTAVLRPILTYGSPVWGYAADSNIKTLEVAQNSIIRNIFTQLQRKNENKINGERQRASASAQKEGEKNVGNRQEKRPKDGEGREKQKRTLLVSYDE